MEWLRQVLLRESCGEGAGVVGRSGGGVVVVDDGSSVGVELEKVDAVG